MPDDGNHTVRPGLPLTTQQYSIVFIMMVATAYRFCDVDTFNLWGVEMTHAIAVLHSGWWDIVKNMFYGELNPPGYRTALYLFTQWLGPSEFAFRAPSVMAGIASVYMVFVLGRRCMSATAGLLAATVLAGSSCAVFASQEVDFAAVFTFYVLASFYCFVEIFSPKSEAFDSARPPLSISANTRAGDFSFEWKTTLSTRPALLAWFWFTSISVVYLHYTGWFVMASELVVLIVWCRTGRSHCTSALVQSAFVPIVLAYLTWLPICYIHLQKIWPQLAFNTPDMGDIKQLVIYLLGIDPMMRWLVAAGLLLSMALPLSLRVMKVNADNESVNGAGGVVLFVLVLLAMLFIYACTARLMGVASVFTVLLPFIILISAMGAGSVIDSFIPPHVRPVFLTCTILLLTFVQLRGHTTLFVFNDHRKADIVSPLKLMMQDSVFMSGARKVFVSHEGLEYYLDTLKIRRENRFQLNPMDAADSKKVSNIIDDNVFYYVDVIYDAAVKDSSPMLDALSQKYGQLCLTRFPAVRLVKFNAGLPPSDVFSNNECPDNTTDLGKPTGAMQ